MNRQVATVETSERAFVFFHHFDVVRVRHINQKTGQETLLWEIMPIFKNAGRTATVNSRAHTQWGMWPTPIPSDFDFPYNVEIGPVFVGPESEVHLIANFRLTDLQVESIEMGKEFCYIWCEIVYNDVFDGSEVRTTRTCSQITGFTRNRDGTIVRVVDRQHDRYNSAD